MRKKRLIAYLFVAILFMTMLPIQQIHASSAIKYDPTHLTNGSYCDEEYNSSKQIYVHDLADVLTAQEEYSLMQCAQEMCEGADLNVLFLTVDSIGMDAMYSDGVMRYADNYMDDLFPYGVENNIAFVISFDPREYRINTMGIAIDNLSDAEIERALDVAESSMVNGNYYDALYKMADYCIGRIVNPEDYEVSSFSVFLSQFFTRGLFVACIITAIFVIVMVKRHNKVNKSVSAGKYIAQEDYNVLDKDEIFVRSYDTVHKDYYKPKSSSGSSRSGGSSHRSSSGRSHGGGGRRF